MLNVIFVVSGRHPSVLEVISITIIVSPSFSIKYEGGDMLFDEVNTVLLLSIYIHV